MPPKAISKRTFEAHPDKPPHVASKPPKTKKYTEEHIKMALYACSKSNPKAISIAKAAEKYGIPSKTLGHRTRGVKPRIEAHEDQQLLTAVEERALARFCEARGWRGEPVDLPELQVLAQEISGKKPGERWPYAFMTRHPELKRRWAKQGESKRANALNRSNTDSFFELLAEAKKGIDPDCIWNCDEKGIVENGGSFRRRVIVGSDQKDPKVTADESRKMVTVLECVSAVGHAIAPLVIHQGAEKDGEWIRSNPCGASIAASPSGWTDTEVMYEWAKTRFDPDTAKIANGRSRLLIFDGHISHCSLKLILFAESKGITILLLPPHTTHRLQPLDVGVFGPLAHAWKKVVKDMDKKGYIVCKNNLISMYSKARDQALTERNIRTAFKRCGIEPYDPSVVTEQDLAPAERNTITSSQPLPPRLPPFLEIVEIISNPTPGPPDIPNSGHFDPDASRTPAHPIIISLADITNLPAKRSLEGLHVRRRARPAPPTKYTSNRELHELVATLYNQVDQDTEELAAAFARQALADFENGRIREKLHAKKGGRAKTTHLKTGARILTALESVEILAQQDRKKVLGVVIKEMGALVKHRIKITNGLAKEREEKLVREETAQIQAAAKAMNAAAKAVISVESKLKTAQGRLTAAEVREAGARTNATRLTASKACQKFQDQVDVHGEELITMTERYLIAEDRHITLCAQQDVRLAQVLAGEEAANKAMEVKEREEEDARQKIDADRARQARLPKRLKEPVVIWMGRFEEEIRRNEQLHEEDEFFDLPADLENDEGEASDGESADQANQRRTTAVINERLTADYGSYVDAELIDADAAMYANRQRYGEDEE